MIATVEVCESIEMAVRAGRIGEARALLEKISPAQIPRDGYAKVAELYRRAGMVENAVRLLSKVVRSDREMDAPASALELGEYAIALVKLGAIVEGRTILHGLCEKIPIANYYLGLTHFPEWNYSAAIPVLENFVQSSDNDSYTALVASANLASAYVHCRSRDKAEAVITQGLLSARHRNLRLLEANFLELSAQLALDRREYSKALSLLNSSVEILRASGLFDELFVNKWLALVAAYKSPESASEILIQTRRRASELKHWETLRDLDHHQAFLMRDQKLYHHLFHGTPHQAYRIYLRGLFADLASPASIYDWNLTDVNAAKVFDVRSAVFDGTATTIKEGQLLHKLLLELAGDFYKPARITSLAARLFEGQFFDLATMSNRVHQLIVRLRKVFSSHGIPLEIEDTPSGYRLTSKQPMILRVGESVRDGSLAKIEKLRTSLPEAPFSIKQAAQSLACSESSALRIVNSGIEAGYIRRATLGKRTVYEFKFAG